MQFPTVIEVEGAGNRFVLWDARAAEPPSDRSAAAAALTAADPTQPSSEPRDGLLLLLPAAQPFAARLVIVNRDGSESEMCGNGLRCVAQYLSREHGARFAVETPAGSRECRSDAGERVSVELGRATVGDAFDVVCEGVLGPVSVSAFAVDVGNPHAVLDASPLGVRLADAPLVQIAGSVLAGGRFANGVNVHVVLHQGDHFEARPHERGVGETRACGTGAGAIAAVAVERLGLAAPIRVRMAGGLLEVGRDDEGRLWLSGSTVIGEPIDGAAVERWIARRVDA